MLSIHTHMTCSDRFQEILPEEREETELTIRELVSRALLRHFEVVFVVEVSVQFSPDELPGQHICAIYIHVQCPASEKPPRPRDIERMELVVENAISCALVELLGSVNVESVVIG